MKSKSREKVKFRVVLPITKGGETRAPGYEFTSYPGGTHITRWLQQGRVAPVTPAKA